MANAGYLKNRCGIIKIVTIIIGVVSICFTAASCDSEWKEEVYLGIAITCLVISSVYLIFHLAVTDAELKTANKALDSGYHFLGAILLLCGGILMVYSAVDLHYDIWYFCTYGLGRGIPCIFNKRRGGGLGFDSNESNKYGLNNQYPNHVHNPHYGVENSVGYGRSFFPPKWFAWLNGGQEVCSEVLPRILECNRYYELKLVGGILGIINGILYGVTGILVLLSN